MVQVADVTAYLKELAPCRLAEAWDNVGLLLGRDDGEVRSVLTCLTVTPDVAAEAIDANAQLIVSHHPILFRPVQRLTADTSEGATLLQLAAAGVAVYSPHTGYDSAAEGINRQLARSLGLTNVGVLRPQDDGVSSNHTAGTPSLGAGRFGDLPEPTTLGQFNQLVKQKLGVNYLQFVGDASARIQRVAVACGSAAQFLDDARQHACDALLTGEARFHACLEARTLGIALVLPGHFATERPAIESLASLLSGRFPQLTIWASRAESDPLQWA